MTPSATGLNTPPTACHLYACRRSCVCNLVFAIPLHAARRAMAAAEPLPKQPRRAFTGISSSRPNPKGPVPAGLPDLLFPYRQEKSDERERKGQRKEISSSDESIFRGSCGPHLDVFFPPLLRHRGLESRPFGRGSCPAFSAWWGGGWPPPLCTLPSLSLCQAHIGPRRMRAAAVAALGHHMRTWAALPDLAPLNRAPVVCRCVVLATEGAPGGSGSAVRANVAPRTTPAAEGIWPGLLEMLDIVVSACQARTSFAKAGRCGLSLYCKYHCRVQCLALRVAAPGLRPT